MKNTFQTKFNYSQNVPSFLQKYLMAEAMERLCYVGMNCGVEYTSFPMFQKLEPYSRFEHSLGCALIVWNFTHDEKQTLATLFHDIATPVFAHSIDFMNNDYLKQESTEEKTEEFIRNSYEIMKLLEEDNILLEEVSDYHRYPIADNDSPKLSSDRLEYTFGNALNFGFADENELTDIYRNIIVSVNEESKNELIFTDLNKAKKFALLSLECSKVYTADADRYAMQIIAELMKKAISLGVLKASDLYATEFKVIDKICQDLRLKNDWEEYCKLNTVSRGEHANSRIIKAKKRYIDPYVEGLGRLSDIDREYAESLKEYLNSSFEVPVYAYHSSK